VTGQAWSLLLDLWWVMGQVGLVSLDLADPAQPITLSEHVPPHTKIV
jgi:hypothetical protein